MKSKRRPFTVQKRKKCPFCADKTKEINYKDPSALKKFITDRGKILPGKITGVCSKHQRKLTVAIKRSRLIALLPFVTD
ncbi:MAG: 30S ribosomal protein S18 [Clostridiales Family XIII bacterium]|jgi:small subunit ribosomal protein S18|nr:30S ribosomal protein S18 [Clostridiales Family XIII bacterium]